MNKIFSLLICLFLTSLVESSTISTGPSNNRVDIVILGEGYTSTDIENKIFENAVKNFLDYKFSDNILVEPFHTYRNYFNINIIDVISQESGADQPPNGIFRNTALGATYYTFGSAKNLTINSLAADRIIKDLNIPAEMRYVIVNDSKYGGSGGPWAVFAGDNYKSYEIALHEQGHSFSGLSDEYWSVQGKNPNSQYEPSAINITFNPNGEWGEWLGYQQEGIGEIGIYEGGFGYSQGTYRPSIKSKMRTLDNPFDAVSREKIIQDIYKYVDPFDSWGRQGNVLTVETVDDIIAVDWYVNGVLFSNGPNFALSSLPRGEFNIEARGYDNSGWIRRGLEVQTVSWNVKIPEPTAIILSALAVVISFSTQRFLF